MIFFEDNQTCDYEIASEDIYEVKEESEYNDWRYFTNNKKLREKRIR